MELTVGAVMLHERLLMKATVASPTINTMARVRPRARSDASSALSSLLSSLSSEDEESAPIVKRRRKNTSNPPILIDEMHPRKRAPGKRGGKAIQLEADVPDRKEYLFQGLYAPLRQGAGSGRDQRKNSIKPPKAKLFRSRDEISQNFKFDLPLHYGETLLEEQRIFRLPWDVLQDFDLARLPESVEGLAFRSDALDRIGRYKIPTFYRKIPNSR